jgi:hypothetical protein
VLLPLLLVWASAASADDLAARCADRTATERVYFEHRTGTKPPFEEAMPAALVERLVREDAKKKAVLAGVYGVPVSDAMVAAEVERINRTTRAPEMLAELKAALGNDAARFARTVAEPLVVERLLRDKFENDDALHAPQRAVAEAARQRLLAAKASGLDSQVKELRASSPGPAQDLLRWELGPRPDSPTTNPVSTAPTPTKGTSQSGDYKNEATAQIAQPISTPEKEERKLYFEDLPAPLQRVLRAQLRVPGDVSAVIETSNGFLVYLAREITPKSLSVGLLSIPKRSYDTWLAEQR